MTFSPQLLIDVAKDEEFFKLAAEKGLSRVLIGIESPNVDSLKEARKYHNVKSDLLTDLRKFNEYGMLIVGSCIVGFDHDDLSIFQQQLDFLMKSSIANTQIFPLQTPDGSVLKKRVLKEGRYID